MSFDVIADIKDRLPLLEYVQRDQKLTRQGRTYVGICPFHSERTGSFTIWPHQDRWHCFGCGQGGDLFTYYQLRYGVDFKEALRALAQEAGVQLHESPERQEAVRKLRERCDVLAAAARFYHGQLQPEHRQYLHGRGFRDDFIDQYLFGFAAGGIQQALKNVAPATLQEIGLVTKPEPPQQPRDFFWRRIIIPVYGPGGSIVNLVGRRWVEPGEEDSGSGKYKRLPGDEQLINEGVLRGTKECWLCEGDTDTPTLVQAGLPAVGVPGALALKDEWAEKFSRIETIYCCADPDAAGDGLRHRAGRLFGARCRIVELPAGSDINVYVGQQGNDITALAAQAKPYLEWLVGQLPPELPADRADQVLEPVFAALARYGKAAQDLYSKQIAKRVGVSVTSFREAIREREQAGQNGHQKDASKIAASKIIWKMPTLVNPAQDLVDGVMITTVFLDVLEEDPETKATKVVTRPYVITSKRETFPLSEADMWRHGWRYADTKAPAYGIVGRRWSTDESAPNSVKAYLDAGVTVNPWDVYQDVVKVFRAYVDYPNDLYYDFLSLWVIATYYFNLFPAFPYLHLLGFKRVGKSRTLQLIAEIAFNALWSASMTAAAAYRSVESCSATLLMDEAENLRKKDKSDKSDKDDDKLEILKAGYQKGQKAIRCSGEKNEPTSYDLYSPKAFGGTQALDKILGDRVIPLILARRGRELEKFRVTRMGKVFAALRSKLYVMMLDYGATIADEAREGIHWEGVQDREEELWTPILTVAQVIDKVRLQDEVDPRTIDKHTLLTQKMRTLATQKVQERVSREQAEQAEVIILEALLDFLKSAKPVSTTHPKLFSTGYLLHHLQEVEELGWLNNTRLMIQQLEKMTVITNRKIDLPRPRVEGRMVRCIRMDKGQIEEIASRYGADTGEESNEPS